MKQVREIEPKLHYGKSHSVALKYNEGVNSWNQGCGIIDKGKFLFIPVKGKKL